MKKKFIIIVSYIIIFINYNVYSNENNSILKVGLLAPLSGEYKELGNSLLYSLQLALDEIGNNKVIIVPRDSGFNNSEKLQNAIQDLKSQDVKVVIGPINNEEFKDVKKYNDLIFISPSNISPEFTDNIISMGVSLESQLKSLFNFLKKKKEKKQLLCFLKINTLN